MNRKIKKNDRWKSARDQHSLTTEVKLYNAMINTFQASEQYKKNSCFVVSIHACVLTEKNDQITRSEINLPCNCYANVRGC